MQDLTLYVQPMYVYLSMLNANSLLIKPYLYIYFVDRQ